MNRTADERRHHEQRILEKVSTPQKRALVDFDWRYQKTVGTWESLKELKILVNHRPRWGCGNPRRINGKVTLQEQAAELREEEGIEEYYRQEHEGGL